VIVVSRRVAQNSLDARHLSVVMKKGQIIQ
jgi:hypothetical protein